MNESELVDKAIFILKNNKCEIYLEVPFMSKCIDMILIKNENLISIEFKISDFKKVVEQAFDNLMGVDYSYICFPKKNIREKNRTKLEELGLGLYYIDIDNEDLIEEIKPMKSNEIWNVARDWLENNLKNKVNYEF